MTFHEPRDWTTGETVTETMMDEQIRDNMNEIWKYANHGDIMYATSGSTSAKLALGSAYTFLGVNSGSPRWIPVIHARQGASSTNWGGLSASGSTTYTPTQTLIQIGKTRIYLPNGTATASTSVTFPIAYTYLPMVFLTLQPDVAPDYLTTCYTQSIGDAGFTAFIQRASTSTSEFLNCAWMAMGV